MKGPLTALHWLGGRIQGCGHEEIPASPFLPNHPLKRGDGD